MKERKKEEKEMDQQALLSNPVVYINSMNFYLNKYSKVFAMKCFYLEINTPVERGMV